VLHDVSEQIFEDHLRVPVLKNTPPPFASASFAV